MLPFIPGPELDSNGKPVAGAVDFFLKIDGIDGESVDSKHKNEIDVLSFKWSMAQSGTTHRGPGSGGGKVSVGDLVVVKWVDKATHNLIKACCSGKWISTATLTCRKASGDNPVEYLIITLTGLIITNYSTGGSADDKNQVREEIHINFSKFNVKYTPQKEGVAGGAVEAGWNIAENIPV